MDGEQRTPKRSESPGEPWVPARTKPSGAQRDTAFPVGVSRWSVGARSHEGLVGKRRSGEASSKGLGRSRERRNALKGEAQERWGLKKDSQGFGLLTPPRG
jgi:hypothetical protein